MIDYKNAYIENKNNYFIIKNHFGGAFDQSEKQYVNHHYDNLDGIKILTGPISHTIIHNTKYNKKIHLFGDRHVYTNKFKCYNQITESNSIYFPDYLEYYFSKEKEKIIDLFIELPYAHDKTVSHMQHGLINNIYLQFRSCFKSLTNKTICQYKYPNVRFHVTDIRYYLDDNFAKEPSISEFNKFVGQIEDKYNVVQKNEEKLARNEKILNHNEKQLDAVKNKLLYNNKYSSNMRFLKIVDDYHSEYDDIEDLADKNTRLIDTINEILSIIHKDTNTDDFDRNIKESLCHIKIDIQSHQIKILGQQVKSNTNNDMDTFTKNMVNKYIGDENGIYSDMDNRFWGLVDKSEKLKSYLTSDVVKNNFIPNINLQYDIFTKRGDSTADDDIIKELIKTNKMTDDSIYIIWAILVGYGVSLMDLYMLGRIFKTFKQKTVYDISAESAENIIIVAGNYHINNYIDFFNKIDSKMLYRNDLPDTISAGNRCMPLVELEF